MSISTKGDQTLISDRIKRRIKVYLKSNNTEINLREAQDLVANAMGHKRWELLKKLDREHTFQSNYSYNRIYRSYDNFQNEKALNNKKLEGIFSELKHHIPSEKDKPHYVLDFLSKKSKVEILPLSACCNIYLKKSRGITFQLENGKTIEGDVLEIEHHHGELENSEYILNLIRHIWNQYPEMLIKINLPWPINYKNTLPKTPSYKFWLDYKLLYKPEFEVFEFGSIKQVSAMVIQNRIIKPVNNNKIAIYEF